jgi:putative hydrolase
MDPAWALRQIAFQLERSGAPPRWSPVFTACRDYGVAVEINCRPERQDPPDDLLRLAARLGCVFAINTDAHAPGQLDWLDGGCVRAEQLGIGKDRVINTGSGTRTTAR